MGCASADTIWSAAGRQYNIDPVLLYAIALKESRLGIKGTRTARPWPWTIRARKGLRFDSKQEAAAALTKIIKSGRKNIDVGLMQINLIYNGKRAETPWSLLDPETNVSIAAEILSENLKQNKGDMIAAVGKYHNNNPIAGREYAEHVLAMMSAMKNTEIEEALK
jgi:hypothetical protein